jgi:hypothetical protein
MKAMITDSARSGESFVNSRFYGRHQSISSVRGGMIWIFPARMIIRTAPLDSRADWRSPRFGRAAGIRSTGPRLYVSAMSAPRSHCCTIHAASKGDIYAKNTQPGMRNISGLFCLKRKTKEMISCASKGKELIQIRDISTGAAICCVRDIFSGSISKSVTAHTSASSRSGDFSPLCGVQPHIWSSNMPNDPT